MASSLAILAAIGGQSGSASLKTMAITAGGAVPGGEAAFLTRPEVAFHPNVAPWVIEHTTNGQKAEFFVVLKEQADLSGAHRRHPEETTYSQY